MNATFMQRLTRPVRGMTTRKTLGLALVTLLAGCATPGVLHVYSLAPGAPATVHDTGGAAPAEVPSFLNADDQLTGFAYDPYTDHFFLRLAPGNKIRVVDRPARAIKREFEIVGAPASGGGDLAVKPLSGHLFLLHPTAPAVIETTRLGELVRTTALAGLAAPAAGIAYDASQDQLLVLDRDRRKIFRYTLAGERRGEFALDRVVGPALGFDSVQRELYAPLADGIGVFGEDGKLRRTLPGAAPTVDVGPRSFIRVF
jgi:hypothetical protein